MPTRNNAASYITERRRAMALYAYNNQLQAAQNAGTSVRAEQPTAQSLAVITDRKQGGCFCATINSGNVYTTTCDC